MTVKIDGIEYVPKTEVTPPTDTAINRCIAELVGIQYFFHGTGKPRANAWDALNEIAPNIAEMCLADVGAAYRSTRIEGEPNNEAHQLSQSED